MVQIILDEDRGAYEAFIAKLTDALAPKLVAMMKKTPQTVFLKERHTDVMELVMCADG